MGYIGFGGVRCLKTVIKKHANLAECTLNELLLMQKY